MRTYLLTIADIYGVVRILPIMAKSKSEACVSAVLNSGEFITACKEM